MRNIFRSSLFVGCSLVVSLSGCVTTKGNLDGDNYLANDEVDAPALYIVQEPPRYPEQAKEQGIEGHVTVLGLVDERGQVVDWKVLESVPAAIFDEAAIAAYRQGRFIPAKHQGRSIKVIVESTVTFSLDETDELESPATSSSF